MGDLVIVSESGLYCPPGDFYIDPWRSVDVALITHGHSDHARSGSKLYVTHQHGVGILRYRLGEETNIEGVDYRQPLTFKDVKVSFHPAGHVLGSSQIRVEYKGQVWVVSGDYKYQYDPTCEPLEPVPCHTFITESTFGLPIYKFAPGSETVGEIHKWWQDCREENGTALILAYSLGKAQRILAHLNEHELPGPIYTHGSVAAINTIYEASGVKLAPSKYLSADIPRAELAGALVVAPPGAADSTWSRRFSNLSSAFASGWMLVRGIKRRRGLSRGFVLSDHADWRGLLSVIEATGAERVLVTHGNTNALVRYLSEVKGLDAATLTTQYESGDAET